MSEKKFYDLANEAFINEDFEEALKLYEAGIKAGAQVSACHAGASQVYIKENKFTDALHHANKALELNSENEAAHFRKGVALYNLGKFSEAKASFHEALKFKANNTKTLQWLSKCDQMLPEREPIEEPKQEPSKEKSLVSEPKYDWYQSDSDVVVTVLLKGVQSEHLVQEITSRSLSLSIDHQSGSKYCLKICLCREIIPEESKIKYLSTKIEVKLKKLEGIRWERLDSKGELASEVKPCVVKEAAPVSAKPPAMFKKDWEKFESQVKEEEKNEDLEGDAALNKLFQQIYSEGSDDVRKAMMKSFSESGGTVLSTNWSEIGTKKVEVQPPEGMEFKKWNN